MTLILGLKFQSVSGMAPISVDDSSASAVHRVDQAIDLAVGDLHPLLKNSRTQLCSCPGSELELVETPLKDVPKVFYWVHIW